jgi:hypothetical protein
MQIQDGQQRIISRVSKTLDETQCRWSATERECFAIVFSLEKLDYFLKGPKTFTLLTDHKSLTYLDRNIFSNSKISRWQKRISEYNFVLQYIEGSENTLADMFSRPFIDHKKKLTQFRQFWDVFLMFRARKLKFTCHHGLLIRYPQK